MPTKQSDLVIDTIPAQTRTGEVVQGSFTNGRKEEPRENIRYGNYWHALISQKLGSFKLYTSNPNHAPLIQRLDTAGDETLERFNHNLIVGTFNEGKGEHLGKYYINFYLKSVTGHKAQLYGKVELLDDNEAHREMIIRLLEGDENTATEILHECRFTFESAEPVVHEYPDF